MNYIGVITDPHIVEPGLCLNGVDTATRARRIVAAIKSEPVEIELLVTLGDMCDTARNPNRALAVASRESYANARAILADISCPQLHLPGNHDAPELLFEELGNSWQSSNGNLYLRQFGETALIGIDCRTGPEPTGTVSEDTLRSLQAELQRAKHAIIFTHYPWHSWDNQRIDRDLKVLNGSRIEEILNQHRNRVVAAFHGHLHIWSTAIVNSLPIFGVAGSSFSFDLEPKGSTPEKIVPGPLGYVLVGVGQDGEISVRPRFLLP